MCEAEEDRALPSNVNFGWEPERFLHYQSIYNLKLSMDSINILGVIMMNVNLFFGFYLFTFYQRL